MKNNERRTKSTTKFIAILSGFNMIPFIILAILASFDKLESLSRFNLIIICALTVILVNLLVLTFKNELDRSKDLELKKERKKNGIIVGRFVLLANGPLYNFVLMVAVIIFIIVFSIPGSIDAASGMVPR